MTQEQGLEIEEDIAQQQKVWRIERFAWTLMGLLILAALLGFVGHGPFSAREAGTADTGLVVSWQRFERYHGPTLLAVRLASADSGQVRLRLGHEFVRHVEFQRIEPEPERVELDGDFVIYEFNTKAPGQILFHYLPTRAGPLELVIGLEGQALQSLPQFVYP